MVFFILSSASATSPNAFTSGTWKVMTGWFYPRQTAQVNIGAGCQKEGTHKKIIIPRIYSRRPTVLEPGLFGNFLWKGGKDFLNRRTTRCSTGVSSTMIQSDLCWMFQKQGWQRHKGLFINDVINFGGYRDPPPSPSSSLVTFWLPPPCARNSWQNWFRDKTAYVGFLTIVEGPSQPVAAMSVTILSFGT